jgi:cystathionine gamma-synthase
LNHALIDICYICSLVLNPAGRHYKELKAYMASSYEDFYFDEDAIYMERNSRDFQRRVAIIDENTEAVCDFLHSRSVAGGAPSSVIKNVFYPKWMTRDKYDICRIKERRLDRNSGDNNGGEGGFGGLFSVTFTTAAASKAFFDNISCFKGPSLGTNFTLACPYTILAHFLELEWAAKYGVEESLVRVSIGMEDKGALLHCFEVGLKAAEGTLDQNTDLSKKT